MPGPECLNPRERAVAALTAESWPAKRVAATLEISKPRVYQILIDIERKAQLPAEGDRRLAVARWWWKVVGDG